jgi:2-polyprenyl-6-methoxyphenol hydroxylase-like FAD-dependent oxidoreductase
MRVLICGSGVGGLSAAIAVRRAGHEVAVFERADAQRLEGFGLNLWPNAVRSLYSLGLRAEFDQIAVPLQRYWTLSSEGEVLYDRPVADWPEKYGAPVVGVYRRDLNDLLATALGTEHITFGSELATVRDEGTRVVCTFTNGKEATGDLLIGADGIHSTTRACLYGRLPYRENPHHSYRWRGIVNLADTDIDPFAETEVFGGRSFFGTIPVGHGLAYCYASGPGIENLDEFMARYGSWTKTHVPRTIAAIAPGEIYNTKLLDIAELPEQWSQGRVTLLGDAAHPMMPDLAQGASQTFVDSAVIGECLFGATDVVSALREYEERRRPDAYRAVHLSQVGMITEPVDGSNIGEIDPISARYERGVEGAAV